MRGTVSGLASCIRADARDDPTDRERAIGDYTKGLEINPKFAVVCDNRAWSCFKAGKAAQGLLDVEKSLELSPNSAHALVIRGSIFEALGRREEAIADFCRAHAVAPNDQAMQSSGKEPLKRLGMSP